MKSLHDGNFDTELEDPANNTMLVMFWASWCGPCIKTDYLVEFEKESTVSVGLLNVEENADLAKQYSIVAVPTYILFKQGVPVKHVVGRQTKDSLMSQFLSK